MEEEKALVERAKTDPAAFGILYERYVARIYSYIYHHTGNHQDAEDLTAKTFYRALDGIKRYRERGLPFSAWLFRIAHNVVVNWYRERSRHPVVPLDERFQSDAEAVEPHVALEKREEREALLKAIRLLPPERRQLLILKFVEGMSNAEIGQIMGRSEGAIKALYHRTLVALRKALEKEVKG